MDEEMDEGIFDLISVVGVLLISPSILTSQLHFWCCLCFHFSWRIAGSSVDSEILSILRRAKPKIQTCSIRQVQNKDAFVRIISWLTVTMFLWQMQWFLLTGEYRSSRRRWIARRSSETLLNIDWYSVMYARASDRQCCKWELTHWYLTGILLFS